MAYARMVWLKFNAGKRDEAMKRLDGFMNDIKSQNGYRGLVSFLSVNNPDRATVVTFWESEAALNASYGGLYQTVTKAMSDLFSEPPQVANQEIRNMDMPKIFA